jgi:hypothetical protein
MSADYYFRMGSTHFICQDYCLAGESSGGITYALLSDGCSGINKPEQPGSPYTDFGARFLVLSALRNLEAIANVQFPLTKIIADADAMRRQTSLPSDSLDATLLCVTEYKDAIPIIMTGDGVIVTRKRNGVMQYEHHEFDGGMPNYLNYQIKTSAVPEYLSKVKSETTFYSEKTIGGSWEPEESETLEIDIRQSSVALTYWKDDYDLVILFSDGVKSFVDANKQPIPLGNVLDVILDLPRMSGKFITRSCNYFLNKYCVEKGWTHYDDFSCAGICLP